MKSKKSRMGRPPLPEAERKSMYIVLRVTPAFNRALLKAAKREHKSLTEYLNKVLEASLKGGE